MKLKKRQREHLLQGVAEGLETGELNKRAAKFKPPYTVTRQQVDHYRKTRRVEMDAIKAQDEHSALKTGLALKENRVRLLQDLAELLRADLLDRHLLWTEQTKGIGSGENYERIDFLEFNTAEVAQLRGVLDDIAAEVGERVKKQEVTGKDGNPLIPKALDLNDLPTAALQALADGEDPMKVLMRHVLAGRG
jgi:hypothetical protein